MHKYANMIIKNIIKPNIFGLRDHRIKIFYEENKTICFSAAEYPMHGSAQYFTQIFASKDGFFCNDFMYLNFNGLSCVDILHILNKIYDENI